MKWNRVLSFLLPVVLAAGIVIAAVQALWATSNPGAWALCDSVGFEYTVPEGEDLWATGYLKVNAYAGSYLKDGTPVEGLVEVAVVTNERTVVGESNGPVGNPMETFAYISGGYVTGQLTMKDADGNIEGREWYVNALNIGPCGVDPNATATPTQTLTPLPTNTPIPSETSVPVCNRADAVWNDISHRRVVVKYHGNATECLVGFASYNRHGFGSVNDGNQTLWGPPAWEIVGKDKRIVELEIVDYDPKCTTQMDVVLDELNGPKDMLFPNPLTASNQGYQFNHLITHEEHGGGGLPFGNEVCGGTATPTNSPSPSPTPSSTPTPTGTGTSTATVTPTKTEQVTPTYTPTHTPTNPTTETPTPSVTASATLSPTPSQTPITTETPTVTPTNTGEPTATPTVTPTKPVVQEPSQLYFPIIESPDALCVQMVGTIPNNAQIGEGEQSTFAIRAVYVSGVRLNGMDAVYHAVGDFWSVKLTVQPESYRPEIRRIGRDLWQQAGDACVVMYRPLPTVPIKTVQLYADPVYNDLGDNTALVSIDQKTGNINSQLRRVDDGFYFLPLNDEDPHNEDAKQGFATALKGNNAEWRLAFRELMDGDEESFQFHDASGIKIGSMRFSLVEVGSESWGDVNPNPVRLQTSDPIQANLEIGAITTPRYFTDGENIVRVVVGGLTDFRNNGTKILSIQHECFTISGTRESYPSDKVKQGGKFFLFLYPGCENWDSGFVKQILEGITPVPSQFRETGLLPE